jgi:hypothetical protein
MGGIGYSVCCFHGCIPIGMVISTKAGKLILESRIGLDNLFMAVGRFAKDKTWCFYVLNYAEPRRNTKQGQWFVKKNLHTEEIPCIDSLKENLKNNDTTFIEKLQ